MVAICASAREGDHRRGINVRFGSQERTFAAQKDMCALPLKADMCSAQADVRFGPIADIGAASSLLI